MLYFIRMKLYFSFKDDVLSIDKNYKEIIDQNKSFVTKERTITNLKLFSKIGKEDKVCLIYEDFINCYSINSKNENGCLTLSLIKKFYRNSFSEKVKNRLKSYNYIIPENEDILNGLLNNNDTITTEFQLRPDLKIKISNIPKNLTKDEADKISKFFKTIYFA